MSNSYSLIDDRMFMELNNKLNILSIGLTDIKFKLCVREGIDLVNNGEEEITILDMIFENLDDEIYEIF